MEAALIPLRRSVIPAVTFEQYRIKTVIIYDTLMTNLSRPISHASRQASSVSSKPIRIGLGPLWD